MTNREAACTLKRAGWPEDLIPTMVAIGRAESGLNPAAVNNASSVASAPPTGWLQVRAFPSRAQWDLTDPTGNAQAALAVYQSQGLGAWSTYPGSSAQFLPAVKKDLTGFDFGSCAGGPSSSAAKAGTGMLSGRTVDPWGIGQGITDAVGYTGSVAGGLGRTVLASGTVVVGLLIAGAGVALLALLFLRSTPTGRGIRRAARDTAKTAATVATIVPK